MAKGDYGAMALSNMARIAADTQVMGLEKAKNALRVAPQITATELQFCIAFRLSPFDYLAAKEDADEIATERRDRVASEEFRDRERRQRDAFGRDALGGAVGA